MHDEDLRKVLYDAKIGNLRGHRVCLVGHVVALHRVICERCSLAVRIVDRFHVVAKTN